MQKIELSLENEAGLKPRFILVGSIAEGTKIHSFTEMDLTVMYQGLQDDPFYLGEDAFTLKTDNKNHPLRNYCSKNGTLNFSLFFANMLERLEQCTSDLEMDILRLTHGRLRMPIRRPSDFPTLLYDAKKGAHYTHSKTCMFNVTQTKSGVCLVFEWKHNLTSEILTVDLIPVLPVKNSTLTQLMQSVNKTLVSTQPPNWLQYLKAEMGTGHFDLTPHHTLIHGMMVYLQWRGTP